MSTNLLYGRERKFGSTARQAALMNHARNPRDQITTQFNPQNISNLTDFFRDDTVPLTQPKD